jgi:arsenate reductase
MNQKQTDRLKILFLCTGNSCRSQMAEGWAKKLKSDVIEPYSAGIETHGLNSNAVKVMVEAGVDISNHRSKHIDELKDVQLDYVVTVCCHANENCPVFPGKIKRVHIGFDDPPKLAENAETEDEALDCYRRVRDQIKDFVMALPDSLLKGNEMLDDKIKELIAVGASISANCHPCIKYHTAKAREMKIDEAEIRQAIEVGKMVRKGAAGEMDELLEELLK